jgi:RimJ/RimL family protein N-acetyltransferase
MFEILNHPNDRLLALYQSGHSEFPLIRSVIEGRQAGRIFADPDTSPSCAMVLNNFGFLYMFGDSQNSGFNASIAKLILDESTLKQNYLLWYKPAASWRVKLEQFPEIFRIRERIRYHFDPLLFKNTYSQPTPSDYRLQQIDEKTIHKMDHFEIDFPTRFWRTPENFLENGFGFYMLHEKAIVGICYTACVAGGEAEVDVATLEAHRGNHIGSSLTQAFIQYCLSKNILPTWDCFSYNEPSRRIAEKNGFVEYERYPFFSFNRSVVQQQVINEFQTWS